MGSAPDTGARSDPERLVASESKDAAARIDGSAAAFSIETLRNRPDFLRAARAKRKAGPAFLLQAHPRGDDSPVVRVGFTCSKKVGNAVARNRAKRRLRAIAQTILPQEARPGWDYVLVGFRDKTAQRPFADLVTDLKSALQTVHKQERHR